MTLPGKSLFITFITVALFTASISAQTKPTATEWKADLKYLADRLPILHANLYHDISPEDFRAAANLIEGRIPELQTHQILVEFARLAAMVGEGHTGAKILGDQFDPHGFPIRMYLYKDGMYVQALEKTNAAWTGAKVVKIGQVSTEDALSRVRKIVPADNEMGFKKWAPFYLVIAEVLHALKITDSLATATFTVENKKGERRELTFQARTPQQIGSLIDPDREPPSDPKYTAARDLTSPPLWLRDQSNIYWHQYLKDSQTLYVQINRLRDKKEQSINEFFKQVFLAWDKEKPTRLVIDIRQNSGGNHVSLPLIHEIIRRPDVNRRGKLFVIIGRGTFSAGQNLVNLLETHTNSIFVGEPTAQRPNHYGVTGSIQLPNSKLQVSYSRYFIQDVDPADYRLWKEPDIRAELRSMDYASNRDPAMEAILKYSPGGPLPSLVQTLTQVYEKQGPTATVAKYEELKKAYNLASASTEMELNSFGYQLLRAKEFAQAVAVFELNVKAYPNSYNVYDSLADAYYQSGKKDLSVKFYERSLMINPQNRNATRMIALIKLTNL